MVEISEKLTLQLAELARLELTELEVKTFTSQLREILSYVEKLQEVNVEGVDPLSTPIALSSDFRPEVESNLRSSLREDEIQASVVDADGRPLVLSSAPEVLSGGFKVPPIL